MGPDVTRLGHRLANISRADHVNAYVELSLIDRTLMLQPLDEADRAQQLTAITKTVFARRQRVYTELAQGPE